MSPPPIATNAGSAAQNPVAMPGLYDRPVLVIDPGTHTAMINRADVDAAGQWGVTGSDDKTVRVWSLADGKLERTIRLPAGPENVGRVYAVAMSPDGALIAAGGWIRWTEADRQEQIYLFDRETGAMVRRIEDLPNAVKDLAFSHEGNRLAAVLGGGKGLRIYSREQGWAEIARDETYGDRSNGVIFASDGRVATTAYDGQVRLYGGDLTGDIRPLVAIAAPDGREPFGIAFSPDGARLAIGYADSTAVSLLDGNSLAPLPGPDLHDIGNGDLSQVAWSQDGGVLFAAGSYAPVDAQQILVWSDAGAGARRALSAGRNTVTSLKPLLGGDLLVAADDPWLARVQADYTARWVYGPSQADFTDQYDTLAVSSNGLCVEFGFQQFGKSPARFDLTTRTLTPDPPTDARMARPRQDGLPIADWRNNEYPTFDGQRLPLDRYETSTCLAIHPAGDRFVLGTEWSLRAFDTVRTPLWTRAVSSTVRAINVTGDGRLVVAAYMDGTIHWHRMSDGVELLAFMPLADRSNWAAWTPEGFYAATAGAYGVLRWHINRGWDAPADSIAVEEIPGLSRPAVLPLVLQELETPRALGLLELVQVRQQIAIRTNSKVPPGAMLHLLAIGISAYNEDYAKRLRLNYAHCDASDLASAILDTQEGLYAAVKPQVLRDQEANKAGILRALATMRAGMERSTGDDLAVVHFSGHGSLVDGKLYLLPYEIDARDSIGVKTCGLSVDEFRGELLELAKRGRVLVLLDACHSGATTMDGAAQAMDSTALRTGLAAANVTVLTSSSGSQVSREDTAWGHGAFTKVLLDALSDAAADTDRNGLINTTGLADYVFTRVASLTAGAQTPGMEIRFNTTVFASACRQ